MGNGAFSTQVKNIRLNANMTMEQFATELGVTKSSVNMWENKGVVPREDILRQIATKYDVSLDTLLGVIRENKNEDTKLSYLQRNLGKLDDKKLEKAETLLKTVFDEIFEDEEEDDGY